MVRFPSGRRYFKTEEEARNAIDQHLAGEEVVNKRDLDLADVWDADRSAVPSRDNSQWVEALLEERFYGQKMRPISEAAQRELKQIAAGRR